MEPKQVTETSEVKTQTPGKFPEESTLVLFSLQGKTAELWQAKENARLYLSD
jgi:fructoselysine-6-P-deglycase FrlB-like protein